MLKHLRKQWDICVSNPPISGLIGFAEGDGDGDGGGDSSGDPPPPKTFSQDEVNALLARDKKKLTSQIEALESKASSAEEMRQQIAELNEQIELAGKSAEEQAKAKAKKAAEKQAAEVDGLRSQLSELEQNLNGERQSHQATRVRNRLATALIEADVYPAAQDKALASMVGDAEAEFDEDGNLVAITLEHDGTRYEDLKAAAVSYLAEHPYFAKAKPGGAGSGRPHGGGRTSAPLADMDPQDLLKLDAQRRAS